MKHVLRRATRLGRGWTGLIALAATVVTPILVGPPASAGVAFNQSMLELINKERVGAGLNPVVANPILAAAAEDLPYLGCGFPVAGRAVDMGVRNYFSHSILNCSNQSVLHLLNPTGLLYSGAAENIAWVSAAPDPLVAAMNMHAQLMASPGHRANILSPQYTSVGIGSWHTAPGQTWSGAGFPLPNVYIVTEIFAGLPLGLGALPTTVAAPDARPAGRYSPLSPARILDTRTGMGGFGPLGPGASANLQVTGQGGVPPNGVAAVAMNVTVTQPSTAGYLTLYPAGSARPPTSNLNFGPGQTVSNLVVVKVGAGGRVAIDNQGGTTQVVVDVSGWFSETAVGNAGRFEPLDPARIFDTRARLGGTLALGPGAAIDVQVAGRGGVPAAGAQAAVMNLTVTGATAASYLIAYPSGEPRPNSSNVNFTAGATVANRAVVRLGADGKVTVFNAAGSTELIIDVGGWYTDAAAAGSISGFVALDPSRIVDSRSGTGGIVGLLAPDSVAPVQISGRGGVPASGARAVVLNATVTGSTNSGFLTIFPTGVARPLASDLNFAAGEIRSNLVVVKLGADGRVNVTTSTTTHVIFDVAGWMS